MQLNEMGRWLCIYIKNFAFINLKASAESKNKGRKKKKERKKERKEKGSF